MFRFAGFMSIYLHAFDVLSAITNGDIGERPQAGRAVGSER